MKIYYLGIIIIITTALAVHIPFSAKSNLEYDHLYPADIYFEEGLVFLSEGSLGKAENTFKKAVALQPFYAPAHYYLAQVYEREKKIDQAISEYQKAVEIDPELYYAFYNLGSLYGTREKYNKAISHLKRAVKLNPYYSNAYRRLADIYLKTGDFAKVEHIYRILKEIEER